VIAPVRRVDHGQPAVAGGRPDLAGQMVQQGRDRVLAVEFDRAVAVALERADATTGEYEGHPDLIRPRPRPADRGLQLPRPGLHAGQHAAAGEHGPGAPEHDVTDVPGQAVIVAGNTGRTGGPGPSATLARPPRRLTPHARPRPTADHRVVICWGL